ncbi:MAG TPA: hypothetical protein VII65_08615 [Acidimicrobiales bacterium]
MSRFRAFWTPLRVLDAALIFSVIFVTVWSLHPSLVFSSSLITGGDTGAHLALPAYLRTTGNLFNFTPWYPGWFAGIPAYSYYFVLPDVIATLLSYVIGFAVAMKLVTILGSVLMPITAYTMGKLFRAPRPIPLALAFATLPFLFDASFTIDGGNLFSTMAGEYSFSLSLALALLTIGLFARGVRTGRGYWMAAIALSLTLASHVLPWFFAIGAVGVLVVFELLQRRGIGDPTQKDLVRGDYARPVRFAIGAGLLSFGLSAWWLLPFATTQNYTDSLGYQKITGLHAYLATMGWFNATGGAAGDRWVIVLGAVGVVVAVLVRDRLGMVLAALTALSVGAFVFDPQGAIWNERLIPFWFITIHLVAGWFVGYVAWVWIDYVPVRFRRAPFYVPGDNIPYDERDDNEPEENERVVEPVPFIEPEQHVDVAKEPSWRLERVIRASAVVALLGILTTVPGLIQPVANELHLATGGNEVSTWANTNYGGYQAQSGWSEYHNLMTMMGNLAKRYGCGRAMWEYNVSEQRFGTPEALMLLPYWTNNCVDSMEGLLFESSPTTPYHFLDQSELSLAPSNPQSGLDYEGLNVAEGVRHLQILGVKYYMAFSPQVIAEANADPQLRQIALTKNWPAPGAQWHIYLINNSPVVRALTTLPNVVANISSQSKWLDANQRWWITASLENVLAASSGPSSWPRATSITTMKRSPVLPRVRVTHVNVGLQSVSFHVSRVGVPILVKISYYPRWHATGASGPYRVSPNLMVVVPTSKTVSLNYTSTPALTLGNVISDLTTLGAFLTLWLVLRKRRNLRR